MLSRIMRILSPFVFGGFTSKETRVSSRLTNSISFTGFKSIPGDADRGGVAASLILFPSKPKSRDVISVMSKVVPISRTAEISGMVMESEIRMVGLAILLSC